MRYSNNKLHVYNIYYNSTLTEFFGFEKESPLRNNPQVMKLKIDIDNAYLDYYSKLSKRQYSPRISTNMSYYPVIKDRFMENVDIFYDIGGHFFILPPFVSFIIVMLDIIREKEKGLRRSLLIIGLKNSSFWLSWFIISLIYSTSVAILLIIIGKICYFQYFINCSIFINFFLFFLYSLALQIFAYFLSTIISTSKAAYGVSFTVIVFGYLVQVIFSYYSNLAVLYVWGADFWVYIVKFFLNLFPTFQFTKSFKDISRVAAGTIDWDKERWVNVIFFLFKGLEYSISNATDTLYGHLFDGSYFEIPCTLWSFFYFILQIIFYSILTWYFDHIITSNRGKYFEKLFFLKKSYWKSVKTNNRQDIETKITNDDKNIICDSASSIMNGIIY